MYAYVFGAHGSDVSAAVEQVGRGEEGNRIRAVAEVTIGDFGSVVAIEAPDMEALDRHVSSLSRDSGTYTQSSAMMLCTLPDCGPGALPGGVLPSYLHGYPAMAFVLLELVFPPDRWPDLRCPGVASGIEAGGRRVLLELGADDVETIQADLAALGALRDIRTVRAAFVPGSRFTTGEG